MTIFKNLVTDYGAVGDGQKFTRTLSMAYGSGTVTALENTWVSGDEGKMIGFQTNGEWGWGGTILDVVSPTEIVISDPLPSTGYGPPLVNSSKLIEWGTDNTVPLRNFVDAHQGTTPVELTIPAGRYCFFGYGYYWTTLGGAHEQDDTYGIKNLIVYGEPDTVGVGETILSDACGGGQGLFLGSRPWGGQYNDAYHHARTARVDAGSVVIVLNNIGDVAMFSVGHWAMMTGWERQNQGGNPTSQLFMEYVKITAIVGASITIATPLIHTYETNWPCFFPTSGSNVDSGGPATLYAIEQTWDLDHHYVDIGFDLMQLGGSGIAGRKITITRGWGNNCYPTQVKEMYMNQWENHSHMELDKLMSYIEVNGGTYNAFNFQSSDPHNMVLNGATVEDAMRCPKRLTATDCHFPFISIQPTSFGVTEQVYYENCEILGFDTARASENDILNPEAFDGGYTDEGGGVFRRYIFWNGAPSWAAKDQYFTAGNRYETSLVAKVLDITVDPVDDEYFLIHTTLPDNWRDLVPTTTPLTDHGYKFKTHPGVNVTFVDCYGCNQALAVSNVTPNRPFGTQWDATYGPSLGGYSGANLIPCFGHPVSVTITVSAGFSAGKFSLGGFIIKQSDGKNPYAAIWGPEIDLTASGVRHIVPGVTTTPLGTDSGLDFPTDPVGLWLPDDQCVPYFESVGGTGTVRLQMTFNQGIEEAGEQTAVIPLRLRLRAA